jgi:hypothetical protein
LSAINSAYTSGASSVDAVASFTSPASASNSGTPNPFINEVTPADLDTKFVPSVKIPAAFDTQTYTLGHTTTTAASASSTNSRCDTAVSFSAIGFSVLCARGTI